MMREEAAIAEKHTEGTGSSDLESPLRDSLRMNGE